MDGRCLRSPHRRKLSRQLEQPSVERRAELVPERLEIGNGHPLASDRIQNLLDECPGLD